MASTTTSPTDAPTIVTAGDPGYDQARTPWNLAVDQRPAAVVRPRTTEEMATAVRWAREAGLRVAVQGTGHNASPLGALGDTLLIRTDAMRAVTIAPSAHLARVEAGALWSDVVGPAAEHGLIALAGSAHDVGVVGYSLGGGISWLARHHGLAADAILAAEVVTADGLIHHIDDHHEADLFWALRGGGGDYAAVTELTIRLFPFPVGTAGTLFFPIERAGEVLDAWRRWLPGLPDEVMSCGRLLRFPPVPDIPEPLRGGSFAVVELAHLAPAEATAELIAPLRTLGPVMDTVAPATPSDILALHMDPAGPVPAVGDGRLLTSLPSEALAALLHAAGPDTGSPLLSVELRHLGGALARRRSDGGSLGGFDGDFLLFAVGLVPDRAAAGAVDAAVREVVAAMEPWRAPRDYLNLRETADEPSRFFPDETLQRLRDVKRRYDPADVFRSNHPVCTAG